jgi:hypothetical protein
MILLDSPVTHFGKSEDATQNEKCVFHLRKNSNLGRVLAFAFLIYIILELGVAAGHILCLEYGLVIASVCP